MTNYFVDSTAGSDSNNGTTMDLAWATVKHAVELGGLSAGDIVWVRNIHSEFPTDNIETDYTSNASEPINVVGWPRPAIPNTTITQADFTQNSKIIENVSGITIDRSTHLNRYITAPDGKQYHISAIVHGFTVDGMASGDEFEFGEGLTNTTQTKNGKVWGFADNGDTTGTIYAVVDSSTTWANNDNITSTGGGDAELSMDAVPVGFLLSSNYTGPTVTGADGKFEIQEDPDYDLAQAIDDSGCTINKATWNADADTLPLIDFSSGWYCFNISQKYKIKNLELKTSVNIYNLLSVWEYMFMEGCLIKIASTDSIGVSGFFSARRVIIEGGGGETSGGGDVPSGIQLQGRTLNLCDVCVCNFQYGLYIYQTSEFEKFQNINLGVEINNTASEIYFSFGQSLIGKNVFLGGANGYITTDQGIFNVQIENFQKILNNHVVFKGSGSSITENGYLKNVGIGDINAPSTTSPAGSTTDIVVIRPNTNIVSDTEFISSVFKYKIWASATPKNYTIYFQNNMGVTLNNNHAKEDIWLKLTYIDSYHNGNITEKELFSTETNIAQRSSDADWDSLTIASHSPAVAGWAILELFVSKYVASGQIYVDPKYV